MTSGSAPARILAFVNQKGGPGKTTLAMHVAGELARCGLTAAHRSISPGDRRSPAPAPMKASTLNEGRSISPGDR